MSKVDAQRAMREAKFARQNAAAAGRRPTATTQPAEASTPAAPKASAPKTKPAAAVKPTPSGELCGHKSMNGRSCTREVGHSEKSHRYS